MGWVLQDTFPTSVQQFFELLLKDGSNFINEYRSARKDTNLNVRELMFIVCVKLKSSKALILKY